MRTKCVWARIVVAAAMWPASEAFADDARFPFNLPNCPTQLVLSAPDIFAGAENHKELVEQVAANPITSGVGTVVQALITSHEPHVLLMLGERPDTSDIQGRVTRGQFDRLKSSLLVANGQSEVAQLNERGREQGLNISNFSVVSATSDDSSVTMIGLMKGAASNENFDLHLGLLVGYAQQCIPTAIVMTPTSTMSAETFEKLVRSLSFE